MCQTRGLHTGITRDQLSDRGQVTALPSFSFFTDNLGTIPDSIEQTAVKENNESKITKWSCLDDREQQDHYIEKREVKRENKLLHLRDFRKQID